MGKHLNKLSNAELERLASLSEEASEVIKLVNKIIRYGYESYHPDDPATTNRMLLTHEIADLYAIITLMEPDFDPTYCDDIDTIIKRKSEYFHYQGGNQND